MTVDHEVLLNEALAAVNRIVSCAERGPARERLIDDLISLLTASHHYVPSTN